MRPAFVRGRGSKIRCSNSDGRDDQRSSATSSPAAPTRSISGATNGVLSEAEQCWTFGDMATLIQAARISRFARHTGRETPEEVAVGETKVSLLQGGADMDGEIDIGRRPVGAGPGMRRLRKFRREDVRSELLRNLVRACDR